jgi:hypothetical protein
MEYENKYASKGVAGTGLGLGIAGTALGLLAGNGGLNLFGNNCNCNNGCGDNAMVNRYEANQSARIAELETEVKLRDSNIYTDNKILALYQYVDGKIQNARLTGDFFCLKPTSEFEKLLNGVPFDTKSLSSVFNLLGDYIVNADGKQVLDKLFLS